MAVAAALPSALKALMANLRTAQDAQLRERLSEAIRRLRRLYGLPLRRKEETGDLRKRPKAVRGLRPSQERRRTGPPSQTVESYRRRGNTTSSGSKTVSERMPDAKWRSGWDFGPRASQSDSSARVPCSRRHGRPASQSVGRRQGAGGTEDRQSGTENLYFGDVPDYQSAAERRAGMWPERNTGDRFRPGATAAEVEAALGRIPEKEAT